MLFTQDIRKILEVTKNAQREREAKFIGFSQNCKLIVKLATFLGAVFHSCISTDTSRQIQFFFMYKKVNLLIINRHSGVF